MKNSILRFPSLRLLSMCIFALLCLSSFGYASPQPSNDVHFCLPLNAEDMRARDSIYAATKHALNLNVGAPRTVRMIYFLPNDRPFRQEVVDSMKVTIRQIQTFYADQMQAHGHGSKTFRFETDARGEPIVHRVDGQYPNSQYLDDTFQTMNDEIKQMFDLYANIYLLVIDNGTDQVSGVAGQGARQGKNGGIVLVPGGFIWRVTAHELGHAFGLHHDFRDNSYIMSYGVDSDRLSQCSAEFLAVHPYFNPDITASEASPPEIELISPTKYPAGSQSVSVQLKVSDSGGLHQVILFVTTRDFLIGRGLEVKSCRRLVGVKDAVVEFDYDGIIPSGASFYDLSNPSVHPISIDAIDTDGNVSRVSFRLWEISSQHIVTLEEHTHLVRSVAFSPDGKILASGSQDRTIKLWDVATGRDIATLVHTHLVRSVAFSLDGKILALGSNDRAVKLWDVVMRQNIATLGEHRHFVSSVAFSSDGITLASCSFGEVKLWDVEAQRNIATLVHGHWVESVAFSPNGKTLATGSWGGNSSVDAAAVRLWDVATREIIATLEGHNGRVNSVVFSPDGQMVASGSDDETVKLWDVATRTNIASFEGHRSSVRSVAFSPDGSLLVSGSEDNVSGSWDNSVKLWDIATRQNIATYRHIDNISSTYDSPWIADQPSGRTQSVHSVAFSPNGTLASGAGSWDGYGTVVLWDASDLLKVFSLSLDGDVAADDQAITSLDVSPESVVSIQVFGNNIQNATGVSFHFEYDADQVLYEDFEPSGVFPNAAMDAWVTSAPGTNPTTINIQSFGEEAISDSGLVGRVRFRTTSAFSGTTIRLVRSELGGSNFGVKTALNQISVTLQLASITPDFNADGTVNITDFLQFVEQFGLSQGDKGYDARYDLDGDNTVGISDFLIFVNAFGN